MLPYDFYLFLLPIVSALGVLEYVSSCLHWVFSAAKPGKTAGLVIEEGSWAWDKARSACWSFNSSIVQANGRGYLICRWISDIKDSQPKNPTSKFPSNRMLTRPRSSMHHHTSTFNHSSYYDVHDSHLSNGTPKRMSRVRFSSACARLSACRIFRLTWFSQQTWETSGTSGPQNAPQTEPHVRAVANLLDSVFALEPLP